MINSSYPLYSQKILRFSGGDDRGQSPDISVIVTLPNGGHEQDVKAMLELYDNPEELTVPEEKVNDKVEMNDKGADKVAIKRIIGDKLTTNVKNGDKMAINDSVIDKMADIIMYLYVRKEVHDESEGKGKRSWQTADCFPWRGGRDRQEHVRLRI